MSRTLLAAPLATCAPAGLSRGPVLACLRPETPVPGDEGVPVRILSSRVIGARQTVTLSPFAAPDQRLTVELDRPRVQGKRPPDHRRWLGS